ncbi:serine/threonine-protein kinase [Streptomyces sp. NPDC056144]|uniref:serine/threonine-protein kinase n=1 Tax=unclassified Streptomyces TaxID=2593676 RepID=UPI0035D9ABBD
MSAQLPGIQPAHAALTADDPHEIGGYRLQARLGAGGMGVVYLAHTPGGRPIALKVVRDEFAGDPEFRMRFAQEVASAERIHGLFTAQVVASGVDAPTPWLATAYVPGPSLQQVVQRHGPLPERTVLLLVAGIAEALQAIHRAGVVHRDLKPANVLIAEDGPRVIDFGIARAADASALTGTGLRVGTAAFMAPEQALGRPVSEATDVFALGALVAYVSSGQAPFGAGPESAALYRVVHEQPDLTGIPYELRDLVVWCLAKRPEDRPTTDELIEAVHRHPLVGPRPEFGEGWLPSPISSEVAGRAVPPLPVHAQPTMMTPTPPPTPTLAPTPVPTPIPAPVPAPRSGDAPRRSRKRGRRRTLTVVLAVSALALTGGAVYYVTSPSGDSAAEAPVTYVPGRAEAELTAPDSTYEFDLKAGKVVPADTATWYLARDRTEFVLPEDSDAFVATGYELGPADCVKGIETEPVTSVAFKDVADERPFCIRSADGKELVVVHLIDAQADDGPVTAAFTHYRAAP